MGQNLELARYPIHWHLDGDANGQYIKNAAIHDTYNRCVTVHGTNNLRVENNVTYNTVGHCFFMEDGIEHGNQFVHNLAIQTKCHHVASRASRPTLPRPERARTSTTPGRQGERPGFQGGPAALGQHGGDVTGSPIRTTSTATTWRRVPTRTASGCRWRSTRTVRCRHGCRARPPGRVARRSASSRATSPTPTTTRSCSTGTLNAQQHVQRDRQLASAQGESR